MQLGLIFGGESYEHEISIVSAVTLKGVFKNKLTYIFCDKDRDFYLIEEKNMKATYFSSFEYKKAKQITLRKDGFFIDGRFSKTKVETDVYINLIHGKDGEDGKLASLFEFFNIKFIGTRTQSAVLSYNKVLTKALAQMANVKTLKYEVIKKGDIPTLKYPYILKPATLGSSIGISIVKNQNELEYALDSVFEYDDVVLVEPFIEGISEYNLAGCQIDDKTIYSIIEEPKKSEFLDFDQKYLSFSGNSSVNKANLSESLTQQLKDAFKSIYSCGFEGSLIRCDFFVQDGVVYLNEINTNPGSLAYYLFDDFESVVFDLAKSLKDYKKIDINYKYIQDISVNK
ncbi:D-alanine--D-alanine ligase [Campylobacter blaseri]|uniref:D-alanine--D-alanine ligase n=1 Tax=Campylobacter blaseri TaxID=2042961 RepID=A0A2P8R2Q5_9BACT|nr:D-alanine--D-alanine ligase [Campylobacter blaseri]PSM52748.1 D-alanine--D-alanine ligase [Campylobacter blaseri]PSM54396.1 D-alanine--D-alanine ligase [Campylobacter blaseri]QKF86057.1 D-alanine--D-alanine ligase [Campylobacter blaseri]